MEIDKKILGICDKEYEYFLNKNNVVAVGLGYKIKRGMCTCEKCIKVFVCRKKSKTCINVNSIIPNNYKGIQTDVVESGIIKADGLTKRVRPVLGGYSIGPTNYDRTGTMGCLVENASIYYILSSNHIIAGENTLPLGSPIIQPGLSDRGKPRSDEVARLLKFIPLKFKTPTVKPVNYVDCAIARVDKLNLVSKDIYQLGPPLGIINASLDQSVRKAGRTSSITYGLVTAIGATADVVYNSGKCILKDQILTTKISSAGDSGALLMDINNKAVGLVTGSGESSYSISNPICTVLRNLNVSLVINKCDVKQKSSPI